MPSWGNFLQQDWINSLGWMLLHSLWQHALIAIGCALLLFFNRYRSANSQYLIALGGVVAATSISAITFYKYQQASIQISIRPQVSNKSTLLANDYGVLNIIDILNANIGSITLLWLVGITVYGLKILWDFKSCQQLKNQHLTVIPEKWNEILAQLATKVGITKKLNCVFHSCQQFLVSLAI